MAKASPISLGGNYTRSLSHGENISLKKPDNNNNNNLLFPGLSWETFSPRQTPKTPKSTNFLEKIRTRMRGASSCVGGGGGGAQHSHLAMKLLWAYVAQPHPKLATWHTYNMTCVKPIGARRHCFFFLSFMLHL